MRSRSVDVKWSVGRRGGFEIAAEVGSLVENTWYVQSSEASLVTIQATFIDGNTYQNCKLTFLA